MGARFLQDSIERQFGVLIVDDEADVRESLQILLETSGLKCFEAESAASGFQTLEKNLVEVDVVLADIVMPGESGLKMIERIHRSAYDVPVIILSGFADREITRAALKLGVFDMVEKPYSSDRLIDIVKEAIRVSNDQELLAEDDSLSREAAELAALRFKDKSGVKKKVRSPAQDTFWQMANGQIMFCLGSVEVLSGTKEVSVMTQELGYIFRVVSTLYSSNQIKEKKLFYDLFCLLNDFVACLRVDYQLVSIEDIKLLKEGLKLAKAQILGLGPDVDTYLNKLQKHLEEN